jgi:hypothetical protein
VIARDHGELSVTPLVLRSNSVLPRIWAMQATPEHKLLMNEEWCNDAKTFKEKYHVASSGDHYLYFTS